jgi:hypothetical protein
MTHDFIPTTSSREKFVVWVIDVITSEERGAEKVELDSHNLNLGCRGSFSHALLGCSVLISFHSLVEWNSQSLLNTRSASFQCMCID